MMINYYNILHKGWLFKYLIIASIFIVVIASVLLYQADVFKINTYYNGLSKASKAGKDYQDANWGDAGIGYIEAKKFHPDSEKINYNIANTYYKQGRFREASNIYEKLADDKNGKLDKAMLYYNLGTSKYQQKSLYASFIAFKTSLLLNDKDEKTRQNFLFVFGQYMKGVKGPTGQVVKETPPGSTTQTQTGPSPNGVRAPSDPTPGPYQVSDKQMDQLLSLSKVHEAVPKGTKSAPRSHSTSKGDGPDY